MKLSKVDYIVSLILFTFIILCTNIAYNIFNQRIKNDSDARAVGIVTSQSNNVFRKYSKRFIWEKINVNTPLYLNDTILTQDNSEAILTLNTGAIIKLDTNSLIQITKYKNNLNLNLQKGSIQAKNDANVTHKTTLQTQSGVIAHLNNATVTMSYNNNNVDIAVQNGSVDINNKNSTQKYDSISKGELLNINNDNWEINDIKINNLEPNNDTVLSTNESSQRINLKWQTKEDIQYYDLYLSKSRMLSDSRVIRVSSNQYSVKLDVGKWYWQVVGYNSKNKNDKYISTISSVNIQEQQNISLLYPQNQSIVTVANQQEPVYFRWNQNTSNSAAPVRVVIAKDASFNTIVVNDIITGNAYPINKLESGLYYWKIISPNINIKNNNKSNIFVITENKNGEANENIKAPTNLLPNSLDIVAGNKKYSKLSWTPVTNSTEYEVKLYYSSRDQVTNTVKTTYNNILIDIPWDTKYIYWEVTAFGKHKIYNNLIIQSKTVSNTTNINVIIPQPPEIISVITLQ